MSGLAWLDVEQKLLDEYEPIRLDLTRHVRLAMERVGIPVEQSEALAQEWFREWIAKAADELVYLGLSLADRRSSVIIEGHETLRAALNAGQFVLLLGAHYGSHTLALTHLDMVGIPMTIIIHPSMAELVKNYGLRLATFVSGKKEVARALYRAVRVGGILVSYADVERDGSPCVPTSNGDLGGLLQLVNAKHPTMMAFSIRGDRDGVRCRWSVILSSLPEGEAGLYAFARSVAARVFENPASWMMWRRMRVSDMSSMDFGWPSSSGRGE